MTYTKYQSFFLIGLRISIGWHFLYEGFLKIFNTGWTSQGYLKSSQGPLEGLFQALGSESVVGIVDVLTIVMLLAAGLTLILGFKEKFGAYAGILLLLMFYLAHPPWPGIEPGPTEGNYFIINKNLIELLALGIIANFPTGNRFGLENLLSKK